MKKINDVVSWCMAEDQILKLQKAGQTYDISDEVAKYLEKANLYDTLEDKQVEVEIDESAGQDGTIIRLNIVETPTKNEAKKEEPKEEKQDSKPESGLVVKELTVGGVSVAKSGVIFKEEENVWYTLDSTISAQAFKDECTKKVVEVTIAPQEKGNDVIKGYILKEEKKEEPKQESENNFSNGKDSFYRIKQLENQVRYLKEEKSESFEAQASVNSANQTVSGMVNSDSKPDFVLKLIERIAEHNFAVMQELKTKKEK